MAEYQIERAFSRTEVHSSQILSQSDSKWGLHKLHKFKMLNTPTCQFCNEIDDKLHFMTCDQSNLIGAFIREALSPLFFQPGTFSWEKVGRAELHTASHNDRLAGLILLSEAVHHISALRRRGLGASPAKFSPILRHRAEVVSKKFPGSGTVLSAWAEALLTQRPVPPQRVPQLASPRDSEEDLLQQLAAVCGHRAPPYDLSDITR